MPERDGQDLFDVSPEELKRAPEPPKAPSAAPVERPEELRLELERRVAPTRSTAKPWIASVPTPARRVQATPARVGGIVTVVACTLAIGSAVYLWRRGAAERTVAAARQLGSSLDEVKTRATQMPTVTTGDVNPERYMREQERRSKSDGGQELRALEEKLER